MIKRIRTEVARSLMVMMLGTVLLAIAGHASAQNSAPPASQPAPAAPAQVQSTQRSTTTTTQTEQTVQGVDPLWFILGGIALLAIILIAILASRGRGRDSHTHVHESTTVVKKE